MEEDEGMEAEYHHFTDQGEADHSFEEVLPVHQVFTKINKPPFMKVSSFWSRPN